MGVSAAYQLHGVRITPTVATLNPDVRLGITAQTINTGNGIITEGSASTIYPEAVNLVSRNPSAAFSTLQMKKAIDTFGSLGLCIDSDYTDNFPGMRFYAREQACVGPATGADHMFITFMDGVCTPVGLSCDHQSNVSISYLMSGINGGGGAPWNVVPYIETAQTLAGEGTFAPDEDRWTMHTARINDVLVDGKVSVELDFGTPPTILGSDSDIEPTFAGIQQHFPVWRFRGYHAEAWFAITDLNGTTSPINPDTAAGETAFDTDTEVIFRKRKTGATTAEHIRARFSGFAHMEQVFDAQGNDTGMCDMVVQCYWSGSNGPIEWDTAYAYA